MVADHVVSVPPKVASELKKVAIAMASAKAAKLAHLKSLSAADVAAAEADVEAAIPGAPQLVLELSAQAPRGRFRLRLWDEYGRNPTDPNERPANQHPMDFADAMQPTRVKLRAEDSSAGRTLTWVVRLQPSGPGQSYRVRLAVLHIAGTDQTPLGDFVYSGPLDDVEEITGRFHFKVGE